MQGHLDNCCGCLYGALGSFGFMEIVASIRKSGRQFEGHTGGRDDVTISNTFFFARRFNVESNVCFSRTRMTPLDYKKRQWITFSDHHSLWQANIYNIWLQIQHTASVSKTRKCGALEISRFTNAHTTKTHRHVCFLVEAKTQTNHPRGDASS